MKTSLNATNGYKWSGFSRPPNAPNAQRIRCAGGMLKLEMCRRCSRVSGSTGAIEKRKNKPLAFQLTGQSRSNLLFNPTNNDQLTNSKTRVCKTYSPFNQVYQRMYRSHWKFSQANSQNDLSSTVAPHFQVQLCSAPQRHGVCLISADSVTGGDPIVCTEDQRIFHTTSQATAMQLTGHSSVGEEDAGATRCSQKRSQFVPSASEKAISSYLKELPVSMFFRFFFSHFSHVPSSFGQNWSVSARAWWRCCSWRRNGRWLLCCSADVMLRSWGQKTHFFYNFEGIGTWIVLSNWITTKSEVSMLFLF